jgi:hypothetical protein
MTIAKRPLRSHSENLRAAGQELVDRLIKNREFNESERSDIEEQLIETLGDIRDYDGYTIMKELDDSHGWAGSSYLVDEFNGIHSIITKKHKERTKRWIQDNGIAPLYALDAQVFVKENGKDHVGKVIDVDCDWGTYTVFVEALGHKPKGQLGTQGIVYNWEEVENWTTPPPKAA